MTNFFATRQLRQFARADEGQAIVLTAFALVVLMLMAGLGIDVGFLRYQKQQMQKAADAGAITGAAGLEYGQNFANAVYADTAANGFANGVDGVTVTVNHPPMTMGDPFYLNNDYVEVIVAQPQRTFFMLVGGFYAVNVRARAVAAATASASGCIYVLDPTDQFAYQAESGANVNATCGIYINSRSQQAFEVEPGACTRAPIIGIVGSFSEDACGTTPTTGITAFSDPLIGLSAPPVAHQCPYTPTNYSGCTYQPPGPLQCNGGTVGPDVYCGGIVVSAGTVTFGPGNVILKGGGLTVNPGANLVSARGGVTFFNTANFDNSPAYAPIAINNAGSATALTAPTTGLLQGILFFQDRNLVNIVGQGQLEGETNTITGATGASFEGAFYFPNSPLTYSGGVTQTPYTEIVSWKLILAHGSSLFHDNYSGLGTGESPIHTATLVE
ncbi:MAG: TadE/TadG family type IV pilus assembly protein [Candidatus Korobacteraceae bacterium]